MSNTINFSVNSPQLILRNQFSSAESTPEQRLDDAEQKSLDAARHLPTSKQKDEYRTEMRRGINGIRAQIILMRQQGHSDYAINRALERPFKDFYASRDRFFEGNQSYENAKVHVSTNIENTRNALQNINSNVSSIKRIVFEEMQQHQLAEEQPKSSLEKKEEPSIFDGFDIYPEKAVINAAAGLHDLSAFSPSALSREDAFVGALGDLHGAATAIKVVGQAIAVVAEFAICGPTPEGKQGCKATLDFAKKAAKWGVTAVGLKEPIKNVISYVNSFDGSSIAEMLYDQGIPMKQAIAISSQASSDLKLVGVSSIPLGTIGVLAKKGFFKVMGSATSAEMESAVTQAVIPAIKEVSKKENRITKATSIVPEKKSTIVACAEAKDPSRLIKTKVKEFIKDEHGCPKPVIKTGTKTVKVAVKAQALSQAPLLKPLERAIPVPNVGEAVKYKAKELENYIATHSSLQEEKIAKIARDEARQKEKILHEALKERRRKEGGIGEGGIFATKYKAFKANQQDQLILEKVSGLKLLSEDLLNRAEDLLNRGVLKENLTIFSLRNIQGLKQIPTEFFNLASDIKNMPKQFLNLAPDYMKNFVPRGYLRFQEVGKDILFFIPSVKILKLVPLEKYVEGVLSYSARTHKNRVFICWDPLTHSVASVVKGHSKSIIGFAKLSRGEGIFPLNVIEVAGFGAESGSKSLSLAKTAAVVSEKKSTIVSCAVPREPSISIMAKVKKFVKDECGGGKLPIDRDFIIEMFEKIGYEKVSGGKGSHLKMTKLNYKTVFIPQGNKSGELPRGLVNGLMKNYNEALTKINLTPALPSVKQASKFIDSFVGCKPLPHRIDYSQGYLQARNDFVVPKEFKGVLSKDLYVIQYHGAGPLGQGRSHKRFMPVPQGNKLWTMEDVKAAVAKLSSSGDICQVTLARIPAGEPIRFLYGKVKEGIDLVANENGADVITQYRFFDFDPNWIALNGKLS